jgi:hypothetical protein
LYVPTAETTITRHSRYLELEKSAKEFIAEQEKEPGAPTVNITHTVTGVVISGVYWRAPADDATIPKSVGQILGYINELVDAMQNNQGCREKSTSKAFLNRWGDYAGFYTEDQFKAICRELVVSDQSIHNFSLLITI